MDIEHITWEPHINHVYSKIASANFMISNAKNILPLHLRLTLYNSLFKSHLQFGIWMIRKAIASQISNCNQTSV